MSEKQNIGVEALIRDHGVSFDRPKDYTFRDLLVSELGTDDIAVISGWINDLKTVVAEQALEIIQLKRQLRRSSLIK